MLRALRLDKLDSGLLGCLGCLSVLIETSTRDKESEHGLMVVRLDVASDHLKNLRDCNPVHAVICDQTHLHFLVLRNIVFCGLEAELLNYGPFTLVKLDHVADDLP